MGIQLCQNSVRIAIATTGHIWGCGIVRRYMDGGCVGVAVDPVFLFHFRAIDAAGKEEMSVCHVLAVVRWRSTFSYVRVESGSL